MTVKILIIRFSSIGDIVLTTPVIRCLKKQLIGDVEIHYLTKEKFSPLLQANPFISKIHTIRKSTSEKMEELKKERFDYVIDLHKNFRSLRVKRKLKALSFTFNKLNWEKWLMVNFKINRLPDIHIVDRYMNATSALGIKNDNEGLDYFIPEEDEVKPEILPEAFHRGYIAFVIGGTYPTKTMPVEKIISVCRKINHPIILLGDEKDRAKGEKIAAMAGKNVYNSCGLFSINQSASLISQANKVITHDTGLMHVAAALNKDIISVWGNTIPEFGMTPYVASNKGKSIIVQVKDLSCRPCSKLGYGKCPKKHFYCMNLIDEEEIIQALN